MSTIAQDKKFCKATLRWEEKGSSLARTPTSGEVTHKKRAITNTQLLSEEQGIQVPH